MPNELSVQPGLPGYALSFPWAEVDADRSTYSSQWGNDASNATMNMQIRWEDRQRAIEEILGWPLRVDHPGGQWKSPTKLQRVTPWRHPSWSWLRAVRIGPMQGMKPLGKTWPVNAEQPVSEYKFEYLTIGFSTLPYTVLTDDDMAANTQLKEWDRYTYLRSQNTVTLAQYGNSQAFKFSPTEAPTDLKGAAIQGAQRTIPIATTAIEFTWYYVPHNYLYDINNRALQIDNGLSKVNFVDWNGYKAGTLLFEGWRTEPMMAPVDPTLMNFFPGEPPRLWNVVFSFKYFDPDRDPGISVDTYQTRGHNLAPNVSVQSTIGCGAPSQTLWYPVVMANGCSPYSPYPFANLFSAATY